MVTSFPPSRRGEADSFTAFNTRRPRICHSTCVSALAAPYRISFAAASKHIPVLKTARLVSKRKRGRVVLCRLAAKPLSK